MSSIRPLGRMLISKKQGKVVDIDIEKVSKGSFYTTGTLWLTNEVRKFILEALAHTKNVLDPFAGDGHLLDALTKDKEIGNKIAKKLGYDITGSLWPKNDSLISIPNPTNALIVTNPPYLANHSAKRKAVLPLVEKYFKASKYDNLYKIALANSLEAADYVVAIIPETFLLSSFPKDRLKLGVVIEDKLFGETEAPVIIACFGPHTQEDKAKIFLGKKLIDTLDNLLAKRKKSFDKSEIRFNDPKGRIALRAVDGVDGKTPIQFLLANEFDYPRERILVSSRLMTYLEISSLSDREIKKLVVLANLELERIRAESSDLVLAPFKGNDKFGRRRRRLDYQLAKSILRDSILILGK